MKNTEIKITTELADELKMSSRNVRIHSPKQLKQLCKCIKQIGFINPIIIDSKKTIIAGHGRLLAAKQLSIKEVPTISVSHLSDDEIRAYALADNKLCEKGEWDNELLRIELDHLIQIDIGIDIDLTGFEMPEIDMLLQECEQPNEDEPLIPATPGTEDIVTVSGDFWSLGSHRLVCGDSQDLDVLNQLMDGELARTTFNDPPFNVPISGHVIGLGKNQHPEFAMASGEMSAEEFYQFLRTSLGAMTKYCMEGSLHFTCMDWRHIDVLMNASKSVYSSIENLCVWAKTNAGMGSFYRSQHELVLVTKKGTAPHINNVELGKHGRYRTNVWSYPGMNAFGSERDESLSYHPTVKPVAMVADAILDSSNRGDIILDGFIGSGTTLLAAERTGRRCYGIEIEPRYVDVAIKRWQSITGKNAIHCKTGQSFNEMKVNRLNSIQEMEPSL